MHVTSVTLENVRAVRRVEWRCLAKAAAGWHVLLGDNGSGKSSVLRGIALALVGPSEAAGLRQNWRDWLRADADAGSVAVTIAWDRGRDKLSGRGAPPKRFSPSAGVELRRVDGRVELVASGGRSATRHMWGGRSGWFSASYGPFRRFAGGDKDAEKLFHSHSRLARHLTLFGESIALSECLTWLQHLQFVAVKPGPEDDGPAAARLLASVIRFVNDSDLLAHGARIIDLDAGGVWIEDANGALVRAEEMSDGYRSVLSLTLELVRQLARAYGPDIFDREDPSKVIVPGVVLIDEPDAHLHPRWQKQIGRRFVERFPKMQFIVATHSPLVCQAVGETGTIYQLPSPGSGEEGRFVTGVERERLVYGTVLDGYSTPSFGLAETRSPEAYGRLKRLATLNQKERSRGLSKSERKEQDDLRASLPTAANATHVP